MYCETWLLSPTMKELLPEDSHIVHFQNAFDLSRTNPESKSAILWVFNRTAIQQKDMELADLPEDTALQRARKALLLAGKAPGTAEGVLVRAFK
ncbi:MAG: hypothetical protein IJT77_01420, partial [Clostridia bacterium]|nr:hypothetical protein [Clostridia bacterium]